MRKFNKSQESARRLANCKDATESDVFFFSGPKKFTGFRLG